MPKNKPIQHYLSVQFPIQRKKKYFVEHTTQLRLQTAQLVQTYLPLLTQSEAALTTEPTKFLLYYTRDLGNGVLDYTPRWMTARDVAVAVTEAGARALSVPDFHVMTGAMFETFPELKVRALIYLPRETDSHLLRHLF